MKTRNLPCDLTDDELRARTATLVARMAERDQVEDDRVAASADFKKTLKELDAEIKRTSRIVREKREYREVEITEDKDWDAKTIRTVRLDTGEIVDVRAMTPQELNRPLPMKMPDAPGQSIAEAVAEEINSGALDSEGVTVKASVGSSKRRQAESAA